MAKPNKHNMTLKQSEHKETLSISVVVARKCGLHRSRHVPAEQPLLWQLVSHAALLKKNQIYNNSVLEPGGKKKMQMADVEMHVFPPPLGENTTYPYDAAQIGGFPAEPARNLEQITPYFTETNRLPGCGRNSLCSDSDVWCAANAVCHSRGKVTTRVGCNLYSV